MEDRIATVLNFPDTAIGYGITTSLGEAFPAADGKLQVPLTINIPTENLTLMPEGDQLAGSFTVHSGFLNENGAISKVSVQPQAFRFPAESRSKRNTISLQLMMTLDPTVDRVAVAVVDRLSQLAQVAVQEVGE